MAQEPDVEQYTKTKQPKMSPKRGFSLHWRNLRCKIGFIIHSNSFFVLPSIKPPKVDDPLITNLLYLLISITLNKMVVFCWIPSHIGFQGNHKAVSICSGQDTRQKLPNPLHPCKNLKSGNS